MLAAYIRPIGPLSVAVQKAYRERVAAGLIKPEDEARKPVVLVSQNGWRQKEDDTTNDAPRERAPVKRRLLCDTKTEVVNETACPSMSLIIDTVRGYYGVTEIAFKAARGDLTTMTAKSMAAYLCKLMTLNSYPSIGRKLGRDHTTIVTNVNRFTAKLAKDHDLADDVSKIVYRINSILHGGENVISDATQLAALQMAIDLAYGRTKLNAAQRELFQAQIDAIRRRIIDAAAKRNPQEGDAR
jgi:hypothetical protein